MGHGMERESGMGRGALTSVAIHTVPSFGPNVMLPFFSRREHNRRLGRGPINGCGISLSTASVMQVQRPLIKTAFSFQLLNGDLF